MKFLEKNFVMDEFIKVYNGVLDEKTCELLIHLFDISEHKKIINNNGTPNFTQLNINTYHSEYVKRLSYITKEVLDLYKNELPDYTRWYPERLFLEEFRLKKYCSGNHDRFDLHVDVDHYDSAKRYLAFLYYLNDDFTGGETDFPYHSKKIIPKTGSVMIFPPMWMYPHAGLGIQEGSKYIMSTYCHYY